ncbi:MAG: acyl-homoserine-lactone synthase [Methylocella sp.]
MLEIVHGYERSERPELFKSMFRHRKSVFIDQKQWELQPTEEEFEIDEFDRDDAVYICSLLPDGSLAGSVRMLSTTTDHMAVSAFKDMFPGLTVRSPTIWEGTRFVVPYDRRLQPNGASRAACEVLLGICLFGLEYGISQMTAIYEAPMARTFKKCGISHLILGRHRSPEHGSLHFGLWDISPELEASVRKATGLHDVPHPVAVAAE